MKVCILGDNLTSLALAKALVKKEIFVDLFYKKKNTKIDATRTIGISKSNIDNVDELEKIDISEEIDRINSHLDQISQSIKSPQLSGKKINFILQEINRESNTILSKFLDKRVSKHAISLKMQAEKLREQIGNIL